MRQSGTIQYLVVSRFVVHSILCFLRSYLYMMRKDGRIAAFFPMSGLAGLMPCAHYNAPLTLYTVIGVSIRKQMISDYLSRTNRFIIVQILSRFANHGVKSRGWLTMWKFKTKEKKDISWYPDTVPSLSSCLTL